MASGTRGAVGTWAHPFRAPYTLVWVCCGVFHCDIANTRGKFAGVLVARWWAGPDGIARTWAAASNHHDGRGTAAAAACATVDWTNGRPTLSGDASHADTER